MYGKFIVLVVLFAIARSISNDFWWVPTGEPPAAARQERPGPLHLWPPAAIYGREAQVRWIWWFDLGILWKCWVFMGKSWVFMESMVFFTWVFVLFFFNDKMRDNWTWVDPKFIRFESVLVRNLFWDKVSINLNFPHVTEPIQIHHLSLSALSRYHTEMWTGTIYTPVE